MKMEAGLKQLFGKGQLGFLIQLAGFVLTFVLSILLANFYGDAVYGNYVLVFSTVEALAIFSMMGYNQLFTIHIPQLSDRPQQIAALYRKGKRATLRNSIVFGLLCIVFAFIYPFQDELIRYFMVCAGLLMPFVALTALQSSFLYSLKIHVLTLINERIFKTGVLILLLLLFLLWGAKTEQLIAAFTCSTLTSFFVVYFLKRQQNQHTLTPEKLDYRQAQQSIFLLVSINLISLLFAKTDTFMVAHYLGAAYAGINNIYIKMSSVMNLIMTGALVAASPRISEWLAQKNMKEVRLEIKRVHRLTFTMGSVVFVGLIFVGPWLLRVYASSLYVDHAQAMHIYALTALFDLFTGPAALVLMLGNKLKYLIIGFTFEFVLNMLLNVLWIPLFQIEGAAWATLVSEALVNCYFVYLCFRHFKLNTMLIGRS